MPAAYNLARLARLAALAAVLAPAGRAGAGVFDVLEPDTDWTLFRPAPRAALRAPVEPRGPATADAGHLQLDVDLIDVAVADGGAAGDPRLELFGFDARLGLTRRTDVQVAFVPYREADVVRRGGMMSPGRGIGDTTVRLGVNLWGNDGGPTAAGLVPFVRLPTATGGVGSGAFEGGLAVPIAVTLPGDVDALARGQVEFADDRMGRRGVHPRMEVGGALGRDVVGPVAARVEWTSTIDAERGVYTYAHELDGSTRIAIGDDLQLRVGAVVGMLVDQPAVRPYLRVTYRR